MLCVVGPMLSIRAERSVSHSRRVVGVVLGYWEVLDGVGRDGGFVLRGQNEGMEWTGLTREPFEAAHDSVA